jgi:AbrB family looped-hinge helix DNA binding protein
METSIDRAGRIVVPKALRDELGLKGGERLEIIARDGRLEIDIPPTPMRLAGRGRAVVAVADAPLPRLTADTVRDTLEQIRR